MNRNWNRRSGLAGIATAAGLCATLWISDAQALARSNDRDPARSISGVTVKPMRLIDGGVAVQPMRLIDGGVRVQPMRLVDGGVRVQPMRLVDGGVRVKPMRLVDGGVRVKPMRLVDGGVRVSPLEAVTNLPWIRTLLGYCRVLEVR